MPSTTPADMAAGLTPDSLASAVDSFPIVAGEAFTVTAATPVGMVRALRAQTAGNVTAVMANGKTRTLKFLAGETRYVGVKSVTSMTVTAGDLEGMV